METSCKQIQGMRFAEQAQARADAVGDSAHDSDETVDEACAHDAHQRDEQILFGSAAEGRFLAAKREGGAHRHANTPPQPPPRSPAATRKPQRRTTRSDATPGQAHTAREQAPCGPAAQVSAASPAANRR